MIISGKLPISIFIAVLFSLLLTACGGGGGSGTPAPAQTPTSHLVDINWAANREAAVNRAGGGYTVAVSGQTPINVPYVSGASSPVTTSLTLLSGEYSVTVTAYSLLNPPSGATGSTSLPSATYTFSVPY